jgi:hypothetical protein
MSTRTNQAEIRKAEKRRSSEKAALLLPVVLFPGRKTVKVVSSGSEHALFEWTKHEKKTRD